jgi:hypothetical protein
MTVAICVSAQFQPPDPEGLVLAFTYHAENDPNVIDIVTSMSPQPSQYTSVNLEDHSVYLPTIQEGDPWAGRPIGIAIRAFGEPGGFWDLDNVRVMEYPRTPNFTDDTVVNFADFAMMAADWQFCDMPETDVTGEGCVDLEDILILMEYWLRNV